MVRAGTDPAGVGLSAGCNGLRRRDGPLPVHAEDGAGRRATDGRAAQPLQPGARDKDAGFLHVEDPLPQQGEEALFGLSIVLLIL